MKKIYFALTFLFSLSFAALAQPSTQELKNGFVYGKQLLSENKFSAAKDAFRPVVQTSSNNPYRAYAHYYYAYSAFKSGDKSDAKNILQQLFAQFPGWNKTEEAYYLYAIAHFESGNPTEGIKYFNLIKNVELKSDANTATKHYLSALSSDALKNLYRAYPNDDNIGKALSGNWQQSPANLKKEDETLYKNLLAKYGKTSNVTTPTTSVNDKKSSYNVALLLPFLRNDTLANNRELKKVMIDLYAGLCEAREKLKSEGVNLNFFAYDTEHSVAKIKDVVKNLSAQNTDLIIGPLYPSDAAPVLKFAADNNITVVNPLSNNKELINNRDNAFMSDATFETQAKRAAEFAVGLDKNKKTYVYYGGGKSDSLMAFAYKMRFEELGGKVKVIRKIISGKTGFQLISSSIDSLDTPAPIFVATTEQVIAVNAFSAIQSVSQTMPIIATREWLEFSQISYEQLEQGKVYLIDTEYVPPRTDNQIAFDALYKEKINIIPSKYVYMGYDMLYHFGKVLSKYGKRFQNRIHDDVFSSGQILSGFSYKGGNDNQYVPICQFQSGSLQAVNKPTE